MRAATAIDIVDSGEIPVPFSISTRTKATICKATKKKIVGGSSSKSSSLSLPNTLVMELNRDVSSVRWSLFAHSVGPMRYALHNRREVVQVKGGRPLRAACREGHLC